LANNDQDNVEMLKLDFERRKFDIEQELEARKLEVERTKIKWTAYSIVGSALAACLTIAASGYFQNREAKAQFELKAAELVLQTNDPCVSAIKVREIERLFPNRMPSGWASGFKPERFYTESDDLKSEIARLVMERPLRDRSEIARVYGTLFRETTTHNFLDRLFPDDDFLKAAPGDDNTCETEHDKKDDGATR
jgi:hypothetical protein